MFKTVEEHEKQMEIAERYQFYREEYPALADIKILNRLHSEGFDINLDQMLQATEYALNSSTGVPASEDMTTKEAAAYLGIPEDTFKGWYLPSYANRASKQEGFVPIPKGAPEPVRLNPNERGKPARFTSASILVLKEWLEKNPIQTGKRKR